MRRVGKWVLVVLGVLVVLALVNAFFTDRETSGAKADGGRIITLPGGSLQVREDGRPGAPPIVLLHGWTASIHWFDRITPLLARRYRVIRVDLLGHGGSAKPRNGYTMEQQADRVAAALERLGVKRALVAGHSTGGEVGVALAGRHPKLARALAVIDSEPDERFVDPDLLARFSLKPVIGEAMKRLASDGTIEDGLGQAFQKGFDVPKVFVKDFKKVTYTAYDKTYDESGDYVDGGRFAADLRSVRVRRLVIFGRDDRLVSPADEAAAYYRREFGVRTALVDGAGHSPMVEQPAATAKLIFGLDPRGSR